MADKKTYSLKDNPGMLLFITYIMLFAVNFIVVYFANLFFPQHVVLGTQSLTPLWALKLSMGELALIGTFAIPFIREFENMRGKMLTSNEWMIKYFAINFIALWVISRFAEQFGLGISSWVVVAILAVVLDVAQGLAMMQVEKMKK